MTRAQRLELLKQIEKDIHVCSLESTLLDDAKSCAIHSAIEELEQEPFMATPCISSRVCEHDKVVTLNKLRSEIENYKLSEDELSDMDEDSVKWGMKIAYDIVDKYKAESEGKK